MKNYFDCLHIKFAEDRMVIMKANMRNIDLHLFIFFWWLLPAMVSIWWTGRGPVLLSFFMFWFFSVGILSFIEFLSDFEEAMLDFFFNSWLKLFLHVIHFNLITFEVLQWILFFSSTIISTHIPHYRLRLRFHINICLWIIISLSLNINQWQLLIRRIHTWWLLL